jgi:hypothetical protein
MMNSLHRRVSRLEEAIPVMQDAAQAVPDVIVLTPPGADGYRLQRADESADRYAAAMQAAGFALLEVRWGSAP